ncbi:retropepsin-like aspartic protease [Candidatus Thiosymbion oneisti]|uniref:retropepsin-like aspartic protease n=1 Tax=Candidatus Thiosymbion oneisti TaxID=589554 RepID=UPI0013FDE747|nr:retropepsin-like aspartic protease [Candidatus Thiosymbion oneisti]
MGLFSVGCLIENQQDRKRKVRIPKILVDTGSDLTWINYQYLKEIGIDTEKKDLRFKMANGQEITRSVSFAIVRVGKEFTTDEVVFAQKGDLQLLGARTLEGLNMKVDSRNKKLVAAGPFIAAGNIREIF